MYKKRILIFCGSLEFGGAERVISILSNSLAEYYEKIILLVYYDSPVCFEISDRVEIVFVSKQTKYSSKLMNIFWVRSYLRKNVDVIVSFMSVFNMYIILSAIGLNIPIIVANRSDPYKEPQFLIVRLIRNLLYSFACSIIVQTNFSKLYFERFLHKEIFVIKNPISEHIIAGEALICRKKKKIVSVGRLIESKNQKMLIDAFINNINLLENYELVFYGDGKLKNDLVTYVTSKGYQKNIIFAGSQPEVYKHIVDAEIFISSSNYEGMSNALVEAMCIGLPVISTKVGGIDDFIINGVNGTLVEVGNLHQLSNALVDLVLHENKRNDYAKAAVKIYDEIQSEHIVKKWMYVINHCMIK